MNDIQIVYIITKLELGGAQKICLELFNHFAPNSYLISSKSGALLGQVQNNTHFFGLTALQREASIVTIWREVIAFLSIYLSLVKLKRKHAFLVVHTHSSKAGVLGRTAAYLAGINNVVHTVHGFGMTAAQSKIMFFTFLLLEQLATLLTSKIICVSEHDQKMGSLLFFGFAKKMVLIRAAVDEGPFLEAKNLANRAKKTNARKGKIIVGSISCFKPQKNLLELIKSLYLSEKLEDHNNRKLQQKPKQLFLEIIGDGTMRSVIEKRIAQYGLQSKITLLGWQENVLPKMLHWDCFALTSLWEGLPCSLVQALLLNQAALCYDTGGIAEILQNKKNGFLVAKNDVFTFADKLNFLKNSATSTGLHQPPPKEIANFFLSVMLSKHRELYAKFFI